MSDTFDFTKLEQGATYAIIGDFVETQRQELFNIGNKVGCQFIIFPPGIRLEQVRDIEEVKKVLENAI